MASLKGKTILQVTLSAIIIWTVVLAGLLAWNIRISTKQAFEQASSQTRTFFQEFLLTRFWNAMHGGIYVITTEETPPNPYLDDPLRDLTTLEGLKLTKMNPAYMTRQIGQITEHQGKFRVHITSIDPIRPENKADAWETKALQKIATGLNEFFEILETGPQEKLFRYMGPLYIEQNCLKCHGQYGVKVGDISGGISVTMPAGQLISSRNENILFLSGAYFLIWVFGIVGMYGAHHRLRFEEKKKQKAINQLEDALQEVKKLSGLLPICSSCKNIRDDQGYWQQLETYIGEHSEAQFSHSICPDCAQKLYPDLYEKIQKKKRLKKE